MSNTVNEMKTRAAAVVKSLTEVQTALQSGLPKGKPEAQVAFMVAFGCAKKAGEIVQELNQALELMSQAEPSNENQNPPVVIDQRVVAALAKQFKMDAEAVTPFMVELNSTMLQVIETLTTTAKDKLAEGQKLAA
jgi:hypothetical protein